jgi:hypothetical protein
MSNQAATVAAETEKVSGNKLRWTLELALTVAEDGTATLHSSSENVTRWSHIVSGSVDKPASEKVKLAIEERAPVNLCPPNSDVQFTVKLGNMSFEVRQIKQEHPECN